MKAYRLCSTFAVIAPWIFSGGPALADDTAHGSFDVRAVVPVYCEINSDAIVLQGSEGYQVGSVMEICNAPDGFQVAASYRELTQAEQVNLNYAGVSRRLSRSGWTPVTNRMGAKFGLRPIGVQYAALEAPLAINLTITYF